MRCRFWKSCKLYRNDSATCNVTGGKYYEDKMAGCYRERKKKELIKKGVNNEKRKNNSRNDKDV